MTTDTPGSPADVFGLAGTVAVVTGAGSGMGACAAVKLAGHGARVAVTDINSAAAESVAAQVRAHGHEAIALHLDVASEADWQRCVRAVSEVLGAPTILISNAALTDPGVMGGDSTVTDIDLGLWDRVMDVNLRGAALGLRAVLPSMLAAGGGSVVVTSSMSSLFVGAQRTAYSASKAALNSLVRSVAVAYGPRGVRCNAVAPGYIGTEQMSRLLPPTRMAELAAAAAVGRLGKPEEIADVIVYLASQRSTFITGQVIVADGGVTAQVHV